MAQAQTDLRYDGGIYSMQAWLLSESRRLGANIVDVWAQEVARTAQEVRACKAALRGPRNPFAKTETTDLILELLGWIVLVATAGTIVINVLRGDPIFGFPWVWLVAAIMFGLAIVSIVVPRFRTILGRALGAVYGVLIAVTISASFSDSEALSGHEGLIAAGAAIGGFLWIALWLMGTAHTTRIEALAQARERYQIVLAADPRLGALAGSRTLARIGSLRIVIER